MVGVNKAKDLPFASTLCGACREVCPVKINIPHMLLKLRTQLAESPDSGQRKVSITEKLLARGYRGLMSSPRLLALIHTLGRLAQAPLARHGLIRRVPIPPFSRWTRTRDLSPLATKTFRQIWSEKLSKEER